MRTSSIFKSRWLALVWAAGFVWFAYDVVGPSDGSSATNTEQATDATGAPISADQEKQLAQVIDGL